MQDHATPQHAHQSNSGDEPRTELGRLARDLGLRVREVPSPPGSAPWEQVLTLDLTTIGSRLRFGVSRSALRPPPGAESGATLWLELHDGPLAVTLTRDEARQVARALLRLTDEVAPDG
jgi:hypothetical protein